ncbi:MAG: FecR family protein [Spirochaetia bacterium]|nr:FecR family protein [Spirochaetia bacterium]
MKDGKVKKSFYSYKIKTIVMSLIFITNIFLIPVKTFAQSDTVVVAVFKVGKVSYIRDGKEKSIKVNTIFNKNDIIKTEKGIVHIQIGPTAILKVSNYSEVKLSNLYEIGDERQIALELQKGRIYSKIVKKMDNKSSFKIRTPTVVAGVRGTEFMVSEDTEEAQKDDEDKDVPTGVFVNEGAVAVESSENSDKPFSATIEEGNQMVSTKSGDIKQQILDGFIKKKMEIFKHLNVMKEKNYELLKKQKEKNKELMEKIKNR